MRIIFDAMVGDNEGIGGENLGGGGGGGIGDIIKAEIKMKEYDLKFLEILLKSCRGPFGL